MIFLMRNMPVTIGRFWTWWLLELKMLLPQGLKKLFVVSDRYLLVRLNNFQVTYSYLDKGFEKILGCYYMHQEGRLQRDAYFKEYPQWVNVRTVLVLNAKQLLKKRLDLPLSVQHNLPELLNYELDRFTPFKPQQCYFLPLLRQKNKAHNRLVIDLLFIAKQKLNHYYQELVNFGILVTDVVHEEDLEQYHGDKHYHYNLLPDELIPENTVNTPWLVGLMKICLIIFMIGILVIPFYFQQHNLNMLELQISGLKEQATEIDAIKTETNFLLNTENKLRSMKRDAPVILNVLEHLSAILPKDTWLKVFEYEDQRFMLQGLSASSSGLIGLLEASPSFKQTTLVSPVTRNANEPLDQFQLETFLERAQ